MTKYYSQNSESQAQAHVGVVLPPPSGLAGSEGGSCLYSNNGIEIENPGITSHQLECVKALAGILSPYSRRAAHTLYSNVSRLVELYGIERVAFITITFRDNVTDPKEARRRFRSFNTNFLSKHPEISHWICVKERQDGKKRKDGKGRGAIHYHMLAVVDGDIRTGFDFELYGNWLDTDKTRRKCPTGNDFIRHLWKEIRTNVTKYGFGWIMSLEPIKSTQEAIARYVGKYISKAIGNRTEEDKGERLVNYSRGWSKNSMKFAWYTPGSMEWRRKVGLWAEYVGCSDLYQLSEKFGSDWCYKYADSIYDIDKTLQDNGGIISKPHQAPELSRIAENVATRQKDLNLVQRRSPRLQKIQEAKNHVYKAKQNIKELELEKPPKSTPEQEFERQSNSLIRSEHKEKLLYLSDEYLEEIGVERKKYQSPTPF